MSRKKTIILSAIILAIIAGSSFTITFLVDQNNQKENPIYITDSGEYIITNDINNVSNIDITNKIKDLAVSFEFLPKNSPLLLNVTWNYTYTESIFVSDKPIQIEITNENENNILYIIFDENLNSFFPNLQEWECIIKISQDFETYSFLSDSKKGDITFKCDTDLIFDKFEFYSTTGKIKVELNNTVMNSDMYFESTEGDIELIMDLMLITCNIFCETKTGNIIANFWDIKFLKNSTVDFLIHDDGGRINLRWSQHIIQNNNLSISLRSKQNVEFRLWCPFEFIRYDVSLEAELSCDFIGKFNAYWIEKEPNHYQSSNINESKIDFYQISMKSLESSVYIKPLDCFKPIRVCRHLSLSEQLPHDIYEVGNFQISQSTFSGTSIELHNNTANVNISIDYLDGSATNLFEAYWDLTYEHGSGIGYGLLKINCSYEIIGDTLKILINLDYAYDRIRPFYKSGEFKVYFHPNYTSTIIN